MAFETKAMLKWDNISIGAIDSMNVGGVDFPVEVEVIIKNSTKGRYPLLFKTAINSS